MRPDPTSRSRVRPRDRSAARVTCITPSRSGTPAKPCRIFLDDRAHRAWASAFAEGRARRSPGVCCGCVWRLTPVWRCRAVGGRVGRRGPTLRVDRRRSDDPSSESGLHSRRHRLGSRDRPEGRSARRISLRACHLGSGSGPWRDVVVKERREPPDCRATLSRIKATASVAINPARRTRTGTAFSSEC